MPEHQSQSQSLFAGRRAVRRAARLRCQAVGLSEFKLLGERTLDVSPLGLLLACDREVTPGQEVLVSFEAPGGDGLWLDAEAEVARVIEGYRDSDPGYCAGLRFTHFERSARHELLTRLAGCPPPVPTRGRGRRTVRPPGQHAAMAGASVLISPILEVPDVVIPLTRRIYRTPDCPSGAFS